MEALQEVASIPAYLPNCLLLKDTVDQAKDWLQEADTLQVGGSQGVSQVAPYSLCSALLLNRALVTCSAPGREYSLTF